MRALTADHVMVVARAILDAADFSFLITQGEAGGTSAQLMQHVKPDADLTLRFGTSITSRKVREVRSSPRATVACQDPRRLAYVVLMGTLAMVEHVEQWRRYWQEGWKTFWPQGLPRRRMVCVRP